MPRSRMVPRTAGGGCPPSVQALPATAHCFRCSTAHSRTHVEREAFMMLRRVEPETLDHLPETDPQAVRSRRDLRRVNRVMGNLRILQSLLDASLNGTPTRI